MPYKNPPACSIEDCDKPVKSRAMCQMHWNRWKRHGDPTVVTRSWGHGKTAEKVGYGAAHRRVYRAKGRAADYQCQHCGSRAKQWAYDHAAPQAMTELVIVRGVLTPLQYSIDPSHYIPLCQPCHRVHDGRTAPGRDDRGRWSA